MSYYDEDDVFTYEEIIDSRKAGKLDIEEVYKQLLEITQTIGLTYNTYHLTLNNQSLTDIHDVIHNNTISGEFVDILEYVITKEDKLICAMILSYYLLNYEYIDKEYGYKSIQGYIEKLSNIILTDFDYNDLMIINRYILMTVYMSGHFRRDIQRKGWKILMQDGIIIDSDILKSIKYNPESDLELDFVALLHSNSIEKLMVYMDYYFTNNRNLLKYFVFDPDTDNFRAFIILANNAPVPNDILNIIQKSIKKFISDISIKPIRGLFELDYGNNNNDDFLVKINNLVLDITVLYNYIRRAKFIK